MASSANPEAGDGPRAPPDPAVCADSATLVDPRRPLHAPDSHERQQVEGGGSALASPDFEQRYEPGSRLGEGSMGEVLVARDLRILRNVAMKRLHPQHRTDRPDLRERFLREARVQGQLEHPSVVPVYDIGVDHEGREYFTMKRVRGRTLEEIVQGLRDGDSRFAKQYGRRRLLTAMSRVCLAVAFAHERGVIHRDLKPANIMLGDYGEVYLLDWGIAKLVGIEDPLFESEVDFSHDRVQGTEFGFVVGTPGYMAPEQARGETRSGSRSDIYALGAILFEALTLRRLHDEPTIDRVLRSTVRGAEARPSVRAPQRSLPPELDAIIARATALDPAQRYESARALNDDLEQLLDGERDSTLRAALAAQHTERARRALALAQRGGFEAEGQHGRAVGELLQALALEPEHAEARATLVQLLLEPVDGLPEEAFNELRQEKRRDRAHASRANGWAYLAWLATFPLIFAMGVRDLYALFALGLMVTVLVAYKWWMGTTGRTQRGYMAVGVAGSFVCVAAMSMFFGPLFLVPGLSVTAATSYLVSLRDDRSARTWVLVASLAAVLLPALAHLAGLWPQRYAFDAQGLTILPGLVRLPERATWAYLLMTNCLTVVIANLLVGRAVAALLRAERRLFAQAWRLRQLLPQLTRIDR